MESKVKKIVFSALVAALACVATMIVKIPSPMKGYINLGDCIVLLSGFLLPPVYGFLAAGLGSALADLFAGYITYAPVTFLIKGAMALVAYFCFKLLFKKIGRLPASILGGVLAEMVMILGYFLFEGVLYGFVPSLVNIPANGVQGVAGVLIGVILLRVLEKTKLFTDRDGAKKEK